jgi:hypothetical protein
MITISNESWQRVTYQPRDRGRSDLVRSSNKGCEKTQVPVNNKNPLQQHRLPCRRLMMSLWEGCSLTDLWSSKARTDGRCHIYHENKIILMIETNLVSVAAATWYAPKTHVVIVRQFPARRYCPIAHVCTAEAEVTFEDEDKCSMPNTVPSTAPNTTITSIPPPHNFHLRYKRIWMELQSLNKKKLQFPCTLRVNSLLRNCDC